MMMSSCSPSGGGANADEANSLALGPNRAKRLVAFQWRRREEEKCIYFWLPAPRLCFKFRLAEICYLINHREEKCSREEHEHRHKHDSSLVVLVVVLAARQQRQAGESLFCATSRVAFIRPFRLLFFMIYFLLRHQLAPARRRGLSPAQLELKSPQFWAQKTTFHFSLRLIAGISASRPVEPF